MKLISKIGLFLAAFLLLNSLAKAQQIIKKDGVLFTMPINSPFLGTDANGGIVTVSNPLNPTPTKVATFNGDIDVTGTIDPTRILFSNLAGVNSPTYNPSANGNNYSVRFEEGGHLNFQSNTTNNILHLNNDGNVGIGTSTPASKFEVSGGNITMPVTSSASIGSLLQSNNRFLHSYGVNNTFLGRISGNYALTGIENTGLGGASLTSITSGQRNTSAGYLSLTAMTTGTGNVSVGTRSMQVTTTASGNVAIGDYTLRDLTSGSLNIGIGQNAGSQLGAGLPFVSTGVENIFIGARSGFTTTAAQYNNSVAIGTRATVGRSNSIILGGISGINGATATSSVGIGTTTPLSTLDLNGSVRNAARVVTATTTLLPTDNIILVRNGATDITITIPTTLDEVVISRSVLSTGTITIVYAGGTIEALTGTVGATTSLAALAAIGGGQRFRRDPLVATRMDRVRQ